MTVELCVLASGSSGNCTMIRAGNSALLIDAGLSAKEIARRMEMAGVSTEMVKGICISHEHSDHVAGVMQFHDRFNIPIFTNRGTSEALARSTAFEKLNCRIFSTGQSFPVDEFFVEPFSVPHDAYEPVGFVVTAGNVRIGVVTDMGMATTLVRTHLKSCRAVVVESNHDEKLLRNAKRPEYLKQRILGRQGHLSNKAAVELLTDIAGPHLQAAYLAHLSEDCNDGELALHTARTGMHKAGFGHVEVHLTYRNQISTIWKSS
jgi:phosphoribosyl 1,2-cyclic phosphodiesterase